MLFSDLYLLINIFIHLTSIIWLVFIDYQLFLI